MVVIPSIRTPSEWDRTAPSTISFRARSTFSAPPHSPIPLCTILANPYAHLKRAPQITHSPFPFLLPSHRMPIRRSCSCSRATPSRSPWFLEIGSISRRSSRTSSSCTKRRRRATTWPRRWRRSSLALALHRGIIIRSSFKTAFWFRATTTCTARPPRTTSTGSGVPCPCPPPSGHFVHYIP